MVQPRQVQIQTSDPEARRGIATPLPAEPQALSDADVKRIANEVVRQIAEGHSLLERIVTSVAVRLAENAQRGR